MFKTTNHPISTQPRIQYFVHTEDSVLHTIDGASDSVQYQRGFSLFKCIYSYDSDSWRGTGKAGREREGINMQKKARAQVDQVSCRGATQ